MWKGWLILATFLTGATCSGVGPFDGLPPEAILISPGQVDFGAIGARRQLAVTDGDGAALPPGRGVSWVSSDPGIAQVDGAGMVTASGDGQATISATLGDQQATALVTVAATIETVFEVTAVDQSDSDPSDNRVVVTTTAMAP